MWRRSVPALKHKTNSPSRAYVGVKRPPGATLSSWSSSSCRSTPHRNVVEFSAEKGSENRFNAGIDLWNAVYFVSCWDRRRRCETDETDRQTDVQTDRQTRQGSESDETGSLSFPITGSGSASDPFVGANICSLVLTSRINCGSNETRSLPTAAIQPAALADKWLNK